MANKDREQLWQERLAEWWAGGKSQRAFAIEHAFPARQFACQFAYWVRRLTKPNAAPALLPVHVALSATPASATFSLRSDRGWTRPCLAMSPRAGCPN